MAILVGEPLVQVKGRGCVRLAGDTCIIQLVTAPLSPQHYRVRCSGFTKLLRSCLLCVCLQTGLAGVTHIGPDKNFTPVINAALAGEGHPHWVVCCCAA